MFIDCHVHFRDFKQSHKETVKHGLEVARDSGLDAVFDMPNPDPPITTEKIFKERLALARDANVKEVFYGVYLGATADMKQIKRAADLVQQHEQAVGIKLYAGHSVGRLGVIREADQRAIYATLARHEYKGLTAVHCEKESDMNAEMWDPQRPITHCHARPEHAEVASVRDQLRFAREEGYTGKLHIAHISSPKAVHLVAEAKRNGQDVSCGVCPHHFIFDWSKMYSENGILFKMNPPLRSSTSREEMFKLLRQGHIDLIETDHAPHTLTEKLKTPFMSGLPGLAWWPLFEEYLRRHNFSDSQIEALTHKNVAERFGMDIPRRKRKLKDRRADYSFDPYQEMAKELAWK